MKSAIVVKGLCKEYGERKAVDNASFEVPSGVVCGFVGPNGSGKTTTIRALLGLIKPTAGYIEILGTDISNSKNYLKSVGSMIEGPAFYPNLSGIANLKVLAALGGLDLNRANELIKQVGLAERANSKFKNYSLGMKQRLGIAAALLPDPDLLILDEPTNGLDPNGILEIRILIDNLARSGKTIFISSHLLSELEAICQDIVMIKDGKILHNGKREMFGNTKSTGKLKIAPEYRVDLNRLIKVFESNRIPFIIKEEFIEVEDPLISGADLNRMAIRAGVILKNIHQPTVSLEETFFEMVRK